MFGSDDLEPGGGEDVAVAVNARKLWPARRGG